jgi:mannose-6-phosphate isomerase-like protein (cupin superfamily)
MNKKNDYVTNMDIKYEHLEIIDVPQLVNECKEKWFNQTLTKVNNSVMRLGILEGEYHWHKHDNDDELFFVLEGELYVDLENKTLKLAPQQGITVTKGIMHRTRALTRTIVLMLETCEIKPTGD